MKKNLSVGKYRLLDILLFTLIIVVFEIISVKAISWFSEIYCISLFLTLSLITIRRWKFWSILPIIASAVTFCLLNNANYINYIVYIVGDLFVLVAMLWFLTKKKMNTPYMVIIYVITGYLSVCIGRSIVASIFGYPFLSALIGFLGTESLNGLIAILIVMIARKQNGLFEDQISYLKRIKLEEEKKKEDSNNSSLEV